ncbi:hypothetical protein P4S63_18040 [Pseudoalteromonas sp. B193]
MRHFEMDKLKAQGGSVGESKYHESAIKQVCGSANFADDNPEPHGCLHAYPVLAPVTSGFIKSIDTSLALAVKGVKRILSAEDVPGKLDIGPVFPGDVLLTSHEIQYHGQPVLIVVADTYEIAPRGTFSGYRVRANYSNT